MDWLTNPILAILQHLSGDMIGRYRYAAIIPIGSINTPVKMTADIEIRDDAGNISLCGRKAFLEEVRMTAPT